MFKSHKISSNVFGVLCEDRQGANAVLSDHHARIVLAGKIAFQDAPHHWVIVNDKNVCPRLHQLT